MDVWDVGAEMCFRATQHIVPDFNTTRVSRNVFYKIVIQRYLVKYKKGMAWRIVD